MKDRIRLLRKELKLSQAAFAEKMGLSRSAINNLENGVEASDWTIRLICLTFNVSEEWLREGTGPMYKATADSTIDRLAEEYDMTLLEKKLLEAYLKLDEDKRRQVEDFIESIVKDAREERKELELREEALSAVPEAEEA